MKEKCGRPTPENEQLDWRCTANVIRVAQHKLMRLPVPTISLAKLYRNLNYCIDMSEVAQDRAGGLNIC